MRYLVNNFCGVTALTATHVCDTRGRMGRTLMWPDKMVAPLPKGTFERMRAVLRSEEDRTDFIREAVEKELRRRESREEARRRDGGGE